MDWIEISIKTSQEGADIATQVFYEVGVTGLVIEDPGELSKVTSDAAPWDYIDESALGGIDGQVLIKAYIRNDASLGEKLSLIEEKIKWLKGQDFGIDLGSLAIEMVNVKEEDWSSSWKKYYKPIRVSDRIVIKPSWESYTQREGEQVLSLDPGMAFGTGSHETTMLCLQAIDKNIRPGSKIIDLGCGTGVLSIASLLLGAKSVTAIDHDSKAVEVAKENASLNRVEDRMSIIHGDLLDKVEGRYDIVVANIIADVIINLTGYITDYMEPDGLFISSGIILDRLLETISAIENAGLEIIQRKEIGEWAMVVARYNG
ncbi:MAG TPA: 50S ribosomal protein L11 methyltransferase [Bacillota bacterium]|nr:50S ribosomal protein L11 methyltransferase [Bacillota bacterium]